MRLRLWGRVCFVAAGREVLNDVEGVGFLGSLDRFREMWPYGVVFLAFLKDHWV